jgi:hypothetical protein
VFELLEEAAMSRSSRGFRLSGRSLLLLPLPLAVVVGATLFESPAAPAAMGADPAPQQPRPKPVPAAAPVPGNPPHRRAAGPVSPPASLGTTAAMAGEPPDEAGLERMLDAELRRARALTPQQRAERDAEEAALQPPPPLPDDRPESVRDADEEALANVDLAMHAEHGDVDEHDLHARALREEARDPHWSEQGELHLGSVVSSLGLGDALTSVRCASTLCAATLRASAVPDPSDLFALGDSLERDAQLDLGTVDGELTLTLYVARDGHTLPLPQQP